MDEASLDDILRAHGGRRLKTLKGINVHVVEIPSSANEMAVTRALRANPNIKFAEPDVLLDPTVTVNDPEFPKQPPRMRFIALSRKEHRGSALKSDNADFAVAPDSN